MEKIICELNNARLCLLAGRQEECYVSLTDSIDELVKKELAQPTSTD